MEIKLPKGKLKVGANVKDMQQSYMLENVLHMNVILFEQTNIESCLPVELFQHVECMWKKVVCTLCSRVRFLKVV